MNDEVIYVGKYNTKYNNIVGINFDEYDIVRSKGFPSHLLASKHYSALKFIDNIPDIISDPDYIGINPNEEKGTSVELVKRFSKDILLGLKIDIGKKQLYVSTMFELPKNKLNRFIHSGRLKEIDNNDI